MLKVKIISRQSASSLEEAINDFSSKHDVINVQYSTQLSMIIGLQQNNAECRTMHYAMITYKEEK